MPPNAYHLTHQPDQRISERGDFEEPAKPFAALGGVAIELKSGRSAVLGTRGNALPETEHIRQHDAIRLLANVDRVRAIFRNWTCSRFRLMVNADRVSS